MSIKKISRRDFLKLSAAGALGLFLSELKLERAFAAPPTSKGLAVFSGVPIYDAPSVRANQTDALRKDQVISLKAETQGDYIDNPNNTVWYETDGGYVYSAPILPVEENYQKAIYEVPVEGKLAEISVPYSLTYRAPNLFAKNAHRLYFESTHWVKKVIVNRQEKGVWYEIYDKVLAESFYVPSYNMRIISEEEVTPLSPDVPNEEKLVHVDLASQMVTAFEGDKLVLTQRCASGWGGAATPKGQWETYHKGPSIHMTNQGDAVAHIYNLAGVPWCSFFTGSGHAFHGTYWHNDYGQPRSNGCINLPSRVAKWVYRWTNPAVPYNVDYLNLPGQGTKVIVE